MQNLDPKHNDEYSLLNLPRELIQTITDLVPEDYRSNLFLVCRFIYNNFGRTQYNIGLIFPEEMTELARVVGQNKKQIGLKFVKPHKIKAADMKCLKTITQLRSLYIDGEVDGSTLVQLSHLVSLHVIHVTVSTLHHLSRLTHLCATISGDEDLTPNLSNLLSLEFINKTKHWPKMTCHNVSSLTVRSDLNHESRVPTEWLAQFKSIQQLTLKKEIPKTLLKCVLPVDLAQHVTSLTLHQASIDSESDIPWHQLRHLSIEYIYCSFDHSTFYPSVMQHISDCTSLTSLNLNLPFQDYDLNVIDLQKLKDLQSFTLTTGGQAVRNLLSSLHKDSLKTLHAVVKKEHDKCVKEVSQ